MVMDEIIYTQHLQECVSSLFACHQNGKIQTTLALGGGRFLPWNIKSGFKFDPQLQENEERVAWHSPIFDIWHWERINLVQQVHSALCPQDFQSPLVQSDIHSIYFYSQHYVVVEEISGHVTCVTQKTNVFLCPQLPIQKNTGSCLL